jgi:hypothetical protein
MAMEAENPALPSIGLSDNHCGVIKDEFQVLRRLPHVIPTTKMYRNNSSRLRISTYSSLSADAEESLGVSPLGSATEGIFAWQYRREPSRIIVWIATGRR